jgi:hypothetical protein
MAATCVSSHINIEALDKGAAPAGEPVNTTLAAGWASRR